MVPLLGLPYKEFPFCIDRMKGFMTFSVQNGVYYKLIDNTGILETFCLVCWILDPDIVPP
jgi:hypothetical protein